MSDIQTRKLDEILSRLAQMEVTLGVVASGGHLRQQNADRLHMGAPACEDLNIARELLQKRL
jgi:hypothetical protein